MASSLRHCNRVVSLFLLLLLLTSVHYVRNSSFRFKLLPTGEEHLMHSGAPLMNTRSRLECGRLCTQRRQEEDGIHPLCEAFNYDDSAQDGRCQLYVVKTGSTDALGVPVYKYLSIDEDPSDGFDYVTRGGHTFVFYTSDTPLTFEDAKGHCESLGGYLLNFDSSEEFDALVAFFQDKGFEMDEMFVGAQDIDIEGDWVTDRYNQPLNFSLWKFGEGEPKNDYNENCAVYVAHTQRLRDTPCAYHYLAVCERTP